MNTKIFRTLILISIISIVRILTLNATEAFHLKDGRIIQGEVLEHNLNGIYVVRVKDGSSLWFYESDVFKIIKVKPPSPEYYLFKPVPKSNLRPMESDLLVFIPTPRTVDAGHSILQLQSMASFSPFDSKKLKNSQYLQYYKNTLTYKVGLNGYLEFGTTLGYDPNLKYSPDGGGSVSISNGLVTEIIKSSTEYQDVVPSLQVHSKIRFNDEYSDFFQFSMLLNLGLKGDGDTSFYFSAGSPMEIRISDKFSLNLFLDCYLCLAADPNSLKITSEPKVGLPYPKDTTYHYDNILFFRNSHGFCFNWKPLIYVNLFFEIIGTISSLPNRVGLPYELYSGKFNSGVRFTFANTFQLAFAVKVGLFDDPEKIGGGAGIAARF